MDSIPPRISYAKVPLPLEVRDGTVAHFTGAPRTYWGGQWHGWAYAPALPVRSSLARSGAGGARGAELRRVLRTHLDSSAPSAAGSWDRPERDAAAVARHRTRTGRPHGAAGQGAAREGHRHPPRAPHEADEGGRLHGLPHVQRARRHRGGDPRARQAVPEDHRAGHARQDAERPADPGPARHEGRDARALGQAARRALHGDAARPRVDRGRDRTAGSCTTSSRATRPTTRSGSSSTRASCGSCRSRTRTATTSPSRPATACGARTCATTTATA